MKYFDKKYYDDIEKKFPGAAIDTSEKNDVCPSLSYNGFTIYIEHKNPKMREDENSKRFLVIPSKYKGEGYFEWGLFTNSFKEVLNFTNNVVWGQ